MFARGGVQTLSRLLKRAANYAERRRNRLRHHQKSMTCEPRWGRWGRHSACQGLFQQPVRSIALFVIGLTAPAFGGTLSLSFTGTLDSPESIFVQSFSVSGSATPVLIQTWGFGGGTNAAGTLIAPGGFDPLIALFSGPEETASIYSEGGVAAADADNLSNSPFSFVSNCPPAGLVTIGSGDGSDICGDDSMQVTLDPGTYTLVLTDANYVPFAVSPGAPDSVLLSDGFADFTGGAFQTCNTTSDGATTCADRTANFAVDIQGDVQVAPEPQTASLIGAALLAIFWARKKGNRI